MWFGAPACVQRDSAEEVVCTETKRDGKQKVCDRMELCVFESICLAISEPQHLVCNEHALTREETGDPGIQDPYHRSTNDAREVRALGQAVSVVGLVQQNTGYNLKNQSSELCSLLQRSTLTWCMPKNRAIARMMPVYHGRILSVINMRKRNIVGRQNIAILVFL